MKPVHSRFFSATSRGWRRSCRRAAHQAPLLSFALALTAAVPGARAASGTWANSGNQWTTTTNWTPTGGPQLSSSTSNTDIATFGASGANFNAPDLTSNRTVLGLDFTSGANVYTFGTTSGKVLDVMTTGITNNSTALQTFNLVVQNSNGNGLVSSIAGGSLLFNNGYNLTSGVNGVSGSSANRTVTFGGAGTITVAGAVANGGIATAGAVTVTSVGTTVFSGNNTYDGLTTMNASGGILTLSGDNSGAAGGVTVTQGTLNVNAANALGTGTLALTDLSILNNTSGAALTNAGNNAVTWSGTTPGAFVFGTSSSTSANNLDLGSGTVTATTSRSMSFAGTGTTLSMGTLDSTSTTTSRTFTFNGAGNTMVLAGMKLSNAASATTTTLAGSANLTISGSVVNGTSNQVVGVNVNSTGTTIFNGANSYDGVTAVGAGATLRIGNNSALGTTVSGTTVASGGVLDLNGRTVGAETLSLTGTGISSLGALVNSNGSAAGLGGAVTLTGNTTIGAGAISLGSIGESGGSRILTKIGAGTLTITGTSSYTGGTVIVDGTVNITGGNNAGGAFRLEGSSTTPVLKLSNLNALATTATLSGAASSVNTGTVDLAVAGSYSLAAYTGSNMKFTASSGGATTLTFTGDSVITSSASTSGGRTITNSDANMNLVFSGKLEIGSTATNTVSISGSGNTTVAGSVFNTGAGIRSLEKTGSGTLTLNGANSYNGITDIKGTGKVLINGNSSASTGDVNVGASATLGGSGRVGGTVNVTGVLAPGNSIESLGTGSLNFINGSTYAYELDSNSLDGDLAFSTGTLDIASGALLSLSELASGSLATGSKLTLISYLGGWTGSELFTYSAATLADDSTFTLGSNTWLFNYNDTSGGGNFLGDQAGATSFVTMTVVPEPSAAMLGGIGAFLLLRRRRDR